MTGDTPSGSVALGQSGATILVDDRLGTVTKCGDGRVGDQGLWLQNHEAPGIVEVYYTHLSNLDGRPDWTYTMERLQPLPSRMVHPRALADEIIFVLDRDVWPLEAETPHNWLEHTVYIDERVEKFAPHLRETMQDAVSRLVDADLAGKLKRCLVHGDPTFANTMLRGTQTVLIDPLPATTYMPSLKIVDLGKIVQSLLGYEQYRFGWSPSLVLSHGEISNLMIHHTDNEEESYGVWYFAAAHFLRLLPYTPDERRDDMMELLDAAARHL